MARLSFSFSFPPPAGLIGPCTVSSVRTHDNIGLPFAFRTVTFSPHWSFYLVAICYSRTSCAPRSETWSARFPFFAFLIPRSILSCGWLFDWWLTYSPKYAWVQRLYKLLLLMLMPLAFLPRPRFFIHAFTTSVVALPILLCIYPWPTSSAPFRFLHPPPDL